MKRIVGFAMAFGFMVGLSGCDTQQPRTAAAPAFGASVPGTACNVTSGPNVGKRGTRTEDGWCEGDWGGTECIPSFRCINPAAGGGGSSEEAVAPTGGVVLGKRGPVVGIVPPFGSQPHEYCSRDGHHLSVVFRNSGDTPAPGNVPVSITFSGVNQTVTQTRRPIPPGGNVEMIYPMPGGCFDPECGFRIAWSNQPSVNGHCVSNNFTGQPLSTDIERILRPYE
jgi:hypothetical protein